MILYGIPTCDTCKKALKALQAAGHEVTFRDLRAQPLSAADWAPFIAEFGTRLINKTSPSYRSFTDYLKESEAEARLLANPTVMKRPLIAEGAKMTPVSYTHLTLPTN